METLEVHNINIEYRSDNNNFVHICHDINFNLKKGEILGIAGESGSGKTTLISASINALPYPGVISSGTVEYNGQNILSMESEKLRKIRGVKISVVPQGSMDSLNPVKRIKNQFYDIIDSHDEKINRSDIEEMLEMVHLDKNVLDMYPHEISGGMKQRVIIAMSLLYKPDVVVMDEPTTGLDVLVQYDILKTIKSLQKRFSISIILVTHDISLLFEIADRIMVLYGGEILELGDYDKLLKDPHHPYTKLLLDSIPSMSRSIEKLASIPGEPINFNKKPKGCVFSPRCPYVKEKCKIQHPDILVDKDGTFYRCLRYPEWRSE